MSSVILNNDKHVLLEEFDKAVEIKKQDGKLLGVYLPEAEYTKMLYAWAESVCPITPEERERRRNETGGITLAELWKKMGVTP